MESSDIGSRRADCGSAVAVICDIMILLPELYTVPDRTFVRDYTVTYAFSQDTNSGSPAAVFNTVDILAHSPVDNSSSILRHTKYQLDQMT